MTNKEYKSSLKPWIDPSVTTKIREKNSLLKKISKCKDLARKEQLRIEFKTIRNNVNFMLGEKKKEYFKNYFIKYKTNVIKVWPGIKGIINVKGENINCPTSIEVDGSIITDPMTISGNFNDYFTSMGLVKKQTVITSA